MNDRQQDPELRAHFEAQRRHDATDAPSFDRMMAHARAEAADMVESAGAGKSAVAAGSGSVAESTRLPRLHTRWRREWAGLAAAAAIGALIVIPRMRSGDDAFEQAVRAFQSDPALGAWQSPTDGLLDLPGDGLLSTIPDVGTQTQ